MKTLPDTVFSRLEAAVDASEPALSWPPQSVATAVDVDHPTLAGRVLIRRELGNGAYVERWCPTLQGLPVRVRDRVLLTKCADFAEPIVTGVIDGFARKEVQPAAALRLQTDETVAIVDAAGRAIASIASDGDRVVVRLPSRDVEWRAEGAMKLSAETLELEARSGDITVRAERDVDVDGETIQLN